MAAVAINMAPVQVRQPRNSCCDLVVRCSSIMMAVAIVTSQFGMSAISFYYGSPLIGAAFVFNAGVAGMILAHDGEIHRVALDRIPR